MQRNFSNVKDTTIFEIRGTLVNQEGLWLIRRDFGKRDFGNSGRVLEIYEGLWQLRRDFGNQEGIWKFTRRFGNLIGCIYLIAFNILIILKIVQTWEIGEVTLSMIINSSQNTRLLLKVSRGDSRFKKDLLFATCAKVGTRCRARTGPGI